MHIMSSCNKTAQVLTAVNQIINIIQSYTYCYNIVIPTIGDYGTPDNTMINKNHQLLLTFNQKHQ